MNATIVPAANNTVRDLHKALEQARDKILAAQRRQAYYANSSRQEKSFSINDRVWLRSANYMQRMMKANKSTQLLPRY